MLTRLCTDTDTGIALAGLVESDAVDVDAAEDDAAGDATVVVVAVVDANNTAVVLVFENSHPIGKHERIYVMARYQVKRLCPLDYIVGSLSLEAKYLRDAGHCHCNLA